MNQINVVDLKKTYRGNPVVKGVSLTVNRGEIVGLLGANGAGKTTTFYMIVGLVRPNGGRVYLNDQDITTVPMYKRARLGLGYLPQEPSIFKKLTVEDNLRLFLEYLSLEFNKPYSGEHLLFKIMHFDFLKIGLHLN